MKKIILFLTAAVILNAAGAWKTDIAGDNQTAVFYNDNGENAIKNKKMKILCKELFFSERKWQFTENFLNK